MLKAQVKVDKTLTCAFVSSSHSLERYYPTFALPRRVGRFRRGLCRDRLHEAADFLCRASLHIVCDVGVGVQREARAEVSQHTGQRLHIHAAGQRHSREGMAKIMKSYMLLDTRIGQQLAVDPRHGIGAPVATCPWGWEQDGIVGVLFVLLDQQVYRLL